jgi:hypothetical protein
VSGKGVLEVVFCGVEGEIPNKQFLAHSILLHRIKIRPSQTVPAFRVSNLH